jgi:hypothetical protein
MQQMVNELERLEVLDESFDLSRVSGFDLEFDGLTFEVEQVRPDLARVHLTAGAASVSVNGDQIAVGDFVDDLLAEFDADLSELSATETSELDPTDAGGFLVARDTGDGWRISLGYTAAEAARDALGGDVPLPGAGIAARGADSPEAAVDEMIRSVADFDFERVIAGFSSEMQPLREYADLYRDDLRVAGGQASDEVSVDVHSIDLEADQSGSTALVQVRGFDISVDADGSSFDVTVDGDCVTLSGDLGDLGLEDTPFESGRVCISEVGELSRDGFEEFELELAEEGIELPDFGPFNEVEVGIVVVEEDGRWFVSPVRTALDLGVKGLQALERDHLDAVVDVVEAFVHSFASDFSTGFDDEFVITEDPLTTLDEFDELDGFEELDDLGDSEQTDQVDDFEDGPAFDEDFEFDLDFPETFEEQIEFLFGDDAACIIGEVDLLEPEIQAGIEQDLLGNGGLSFEAGEALASVLDRCGAFES